MIKEKLKTNKFLSIVVAIALVSSMILPTAVFAQVTGATATATVVEQAGGGYEKTVTVLFNEEIVLDTSASLDTDIVVSGKTFGTGASYALNTDQKTLVITLGSDSDIAVGESIEFSNNVVYDATAPTDYFNDSVTISGSLTPATINYDITPSDATVEITGYATNPTEVGVGSFAYTVSKTNYITQSGTLTVEETDLGTTVDLTVNLEKNGADYTALNTALLVAAAINADDYTAASYAVLTSAVSTAQALATDLKFDQQADIDNAVADIDNAINSLVPLKEVNFMAVAVADDASVNYAKATKITLVFAEPIQTGANILNALSIKDSVLSASWADVNNTIYELVLKSDANLANNTAIAFTMDNAIKTKTGAVLKNTTSNVVGNLEEASEKVTADSMAATIVKVSDKPGVVAGDKIVIVFNAPVKDSPASINVTTDTAEAFTANVVAGTSNTVYEIVLGDNDTISDSSKLNYGTITNVALDGTFGQATAPKVLNAYAVDNDGTVLVANDNIVVVFDIPTNGVAITSAQLSTAGILTGIPGASFGSNSTATWEDDNTKLVIKIGDTATVSNGIKINLSGLGIKDKYGIVDANIPTKTVEGSFGYTVQPRITKAVAFTQNDLDYIRVFFNTEVKAKALETIDPTISSGFTMGSSASKGLVDSGNGLTYYEIVMAKDEHSSFESGKYTISLTGVVDKETGTKELATTPITITGAFVSPITPELLSVVAISADGSGVAKNGDKIVAVFNTEVTLGNISASNGYLGTESAVAYSGTSKNVIEISISGSNINVVPGTTSITFNGFKDLATESVEMASTTKNVGGSFGYSEEPVILSATAISNDGSGVPKKGDKIVVVFNTLVTYDNNDIYYYEYILNSDNEYKIGDTFTIDVVSKATGKEYNIQKAITGSFGYSVLPTVKSVVLSEADGKETITVLFDRATNKATIDTSVLYEQNKHLGQGVTAVWSDANILKITLANTATTKSTDKLNIFGFGIKAADTKAEITGINALDIEGTLIPVVKAVNASGKNIVIEFSTRTNGIANISGLTTLLGTGAKTAWSDYNKKLTITLGENYTITNNGYLVLNGMGIYDAFSGKYHVVGQYKVSGSIETEKLVVSKVVAQSTDKSSVVAKKGDKIIIKFNSATNTKGVGLNTLANVDDIVTVAGGNEKAFGTGYTGMWTAYDTFEIVLGGSTVDTSVDPSVTTGNDPDIAIGDAIKISGVSFANGEGTMDDADVNVSGSFDGREFVITNGSLVQLGTNNTGDYRVSMKIENTLLNTSIIPTIVCVAYNNTSPVSISRMSVDVANSIQPTFEFYGNNKITSAKIYVFSEEFADASSSPEVLAETVEIK